MPDINKDKMIKHGRRLLPTVFLVYRGHAPREYPPTAAGIDGAYARNKNKKVEKKTMSNKTEKTTAAAILENIPANVKNDVTTAQGAELETVKKIELPEKTEKEKAEERKQAARKLAKTLFIERYNGHAAEMLKARTVTENGGGKQKISDFSFSWEDENGDTLTDTGAIPVTAVISKDAAKAFRSAAESVQAYVVPFHVAADDEKRAAIRLIVEKEVNLMFSLCRVPRTAKKSEIADILESAYMTNANGDYDSENENAIISSVSAIARRILKGRENAENADKARKDAANKAKEVKTA